MKIKRVIKKGLVLILIFISAVMLLGIGFRVNAIEGRYIPMFGAALIIIGAIMLTAVIPLIWFEELHRQKEQEEISDERRRFYQNSLK